VCGRYSLFAPAGVLADRFDAAVPESYGPRYNCAPGQELPILPDDDPERFRRATWGFTPGWAEESFDLINARAETVADKPAFAEAFERRRCVVPADGFYEWVEESGGNHPYRVALEGDRPFAMAGIRSRWEPPTTQASLGEFGSGGPETEPIETFAVVTTEPNDVVAELHDRMAVILDGEAVDRWLDPDASTAELTDLLDPYPAEAFRSYRVSTAVNDPANDDPSLIEPVEGD